MTRDPIVQKWLDGKTDAGGCIAVLAHALAIERALRQSDSGDAATLRGYVATYGETPMMTLARLDRAISDLKKYQAEIREYRMKERGKPVGWKLVPVEPTDLMVSAMESSIVHGERDMYRAAIAAAPLHPRKEIE